MTKTVIGNATLYLGDCLQILPTLDLVDGLVTDPPYSSGGQFRGDRAQDTRTKYVQSDSWNKTLPEFSGDTRDQRSFHFWAALWASACRQLTRPGGIACIFSDWRQLPVSSDYLQAGGWVWRGVVPWVKTSYRPQMGRFGAQCEYILFGSNGPLPSERGVGCLPGFFSYGTPSDREHVTQKPDGLLCDVVQVVSQWGVVLDPFMGSGTTGVAAAMTGRGFVGVEISEEYYELACRRISAAHAQGQLFGASPIGTQGEL